jgi:glycosyltransferase involved in cell wall biosynthesis
MRCASAVKFDLHIVFLGRGTREADDDIANVFAGIPVKVTNLGLCELGEVGRVLAESDAMLCVRGNLNLRRGSALAGIACGVPMLAYAGAAEGTPLMDAGIEFVPNGDPEALGAALIRVLTNGALQQVMRERNRRVYRSHFSWDTIAAAFVSSLIEGPKVL